MLSDKDPRVQAFVKTLTKHGAVYRGVSTDGTMLKFDVPPTSMLAHDRSAISHMTKLCKIVTDYKIGVRWLKDAPEPKKEAPKPSPHKEGTVAYEEEINEMIRSSVNARVSESEFIRIRNRCLEARGMTMQSFSDQLMEGLINGHSVEDQLNSIKEGYLTRKRCRGE